MTGIELNDFVSRTIYDIAKGVVDAQKAIERDEIPAHVNPIYEHGTTQKIEFDISVVAERAANAEGGVAINVWSVKLGATGSNDSKSSESARIRFSIPVRLPTSGKLPPPALPMATGGSSRH